MVVPVLSKCLGHGRAVAEHPPAALVFGVPEEHRREHHEIYILGLHGMGACVAHQEGPSLCEYLLCI